MKQHIYTLMWLLAGMGLSLQLSAQGTITGVISDNTGEPLIGANVIIKGTNKGTITDFDGSYILENVEPGSFTLAASYTGYVSQERQVSLTDGQQLSINFELSENVEMLDEVVVVGYGTKRRSELVGSISKLEEDELTEVNVQSFEQALQGQASGVQVTQGSGLAGSASVVRIRGTSSITSGGDPLYVVDGIPITQDYFLGENRGNQNNNPLATINPNDIESVEVLKDASAAAIYGSRAANGVIIITTKRGKKGKPQFTFSTRLGFSEPTKVLEFMNSEELLQIHQEAWENDGNVGRAPLPVALTNENYDAENYTYEEVEQINTDWFDEVLQKGFKQEYNLSMRQGGELFNTYVGASYSDNETYMVGNRFQRLSGRVNVDITPSEKLKIGISTSLARGLTDRVDPLAGGLGLAQSTALPIYPIYNKDGEFFRPDLNPVARQELLQQRTIELRSINNISLSYLPVPELTITVQGNYDYMNLRDHQLEDFEWIRVTNINNPGNPLLQDTLGISRQWRTLANNWSTFATAEYRFDKVLPRTHSLSVLGGVEYQRSELEGRFREYRLNDFVYREEIGDSTILNAGNEFIIDDEKFISFFGRLNYNYLDRYFLQFTFRRDGSSRFGDNNRFGNFPSVGLGWILSREDFWNSRWFTYLKFKASWGRTGNDEIPWQEQFASVTVLDSTETNAAETYNNQPIRYLRRPANPDLRWEVVNTYDVGFEMGFWEDRLTAELVYYYQRTTDAILNIPTPASSGWAELSQARNVGKIENQGVEFTLTSRNIVARDPGGFSWTTNFNLGHNRNKVLEVAAATPDALAGGFGDTRAIEGEALNTNFIIVYAGLDAETGRPLYEEVDPETGEPTGNLIFQYREAFDRQVVGNGFPSVFGGLNNTFKWGRFDLSVFFVYSFGGQIYDDAAKRQLGVVSINNEGAWNMRRDLIGNYWQQPGDQTMFPRLTLDPATYGLNGIWNHNHTNWLESADYVRLRTLTFGYNIPIRSSFISRFRVYFTGQNLLTFTNYSGWDPEVARERTNPQERNVGGTNVTFLTPPQERVYMFGLDIDF